MPFVNSLPNNFLVHLYSSFLHFFIFSLLFPEHKHLSLSLSQAQINIQRLYMTMYLRNIQKKKGSLNLYSFSKTIHSLIWKKMYRAFKKKNLTTMIKPRSSQLDPASHKRIKHISTQPINHPTSSNRPKSKKFQNKTKAHNSKHHVTQQPPSAMAPLIATHLSSSNPTIQHHMIHIYQKKKHHNS